LSLFLSGREIADSFVLDSPRAHWPWLRRVLGALLARLLTGLNSEGLLARLNGAEEIDWSRAVVDSSYVRAVLGASKPVPAQWTGAKLARSTT